MADERPRFTTIAANWQNFNAVDIAPAAPAVQRVEMQRAFMAGAATTLMLAIDAHAYADFDAEVKIMFAELQTWLAMANARRQQHGS